MRTRLGALLRTLRRQGWQNRDLVLLWIALTAAQPLVPPGHVLARPDLIPWTALTLACAVYMRGRILGAGPHPMLVPRRTSGGRSLRAITGALTVITLPVVYELSRDPSETNGWRTLGMLATTGFFLYLGREQERTGWDPRRRARAFPAMAVGGLILAITLSLGQIDANASSEPVTWATRSALLGLSCLSVGLVHGNARNFFQRMAAGRSDGPGVSLEIFRPALALLGPGLGLFLLFALTQARLGPLGYSQSFVVSVFVLAWVGVLWPKRQPLLVPCILHEVVPSGGKDLPATDQARGFERPPEGALRLNPLDIQRTRSIHPWLVPVIGARIQELDDPVRPLWQRKAPPSPAHVLGDASFEPDPVTGAAQTDILTLRVAQRSDIGALSAGGAQSRRVSVLCAFPDMAAAAKEAPTYAWDEELPPGSLQVMDAATDSLELSNGSVLVLSTEGVARAYELEICEPILERRSLEHYRPPQLEDYAEVAG